MWCKQTIRVSFRFAIVSSSNVDGVAVVVFFFFLWLIMIGVPQHEGDLCPEMNILSSGVFVQK